MNHTDRLARLERSLGSAPCPAHPDRVMPHVRCTAAELLTGADPAAGLAPPPACPACGRTPEQIIMHEVIVKDRDEARAVSAWVARQPA